VLAHGHHRANAGLNDTTSLELKDVSWTAVASAARHRFRTQGNRPPTAAPAPARKRRRRFALPAHSRTLSLHPR